jgi:hypothetical protein
MILHLALSILLSNVCSTLPSPGWIRVGGVLASLFGFYYVGAAMDDIDGRMPLQFYRSTILGRVLLSMTFTLLVALRQCEMGMMWLAAANLASAAAMHKAVADRVGAGGILKN